MSMFLPYFLENIQPRTHPPVENYCSRSHNHGRAQLRCPCWSKLRA